MQTETNKPLYQVLNSHRTQGKVIVVKTGFNTILSTVEKDIAQISRINIPISPLELEYDNLQLKATIEEQSNAEYIALSVNNFSAVCEALQLLMNEVNLSKLSIKKDFSLLNAHANASKVLHNIK